MTDGSVTGDGGSRRSRSEAAIRDHLANERTLLAWQRTALTVVGLARRCPRSRTGSAFETGTRRSVPAPLPHGPARARRAHRGRGATLAADRSPGRAPARQIVATERRSPTRASYLPFRDGAPAAHAVPSMPSARPRPGPRSTCTQRAATAPEHIGRRSSRAGRPCRRIEEGVTVLGQREPGAEALDGVAQQAGARCRSGGDSDDRSRASTAAAAVRSTEERGRPCRRR